ncbi:ArnT family glycosyltransferase [Mucilaginibacter agri]|uniref:Glycosyl transferase n=1 Tax=Mucilaginibacter agri TaxID=2695265 RepID=A0A966DUG5_9SPHI|nr:glycosyltransferase family 39 protein [Mucilaginibacter agri]NCD70421.1 glycosyl transferase [Mucilaginibacter agri]
MVINKRIFLLLLILGVAVNLLGLNTPFFTDDPGLYASVPKQMIYHHNYWCLFSYNHDWLDKPHFPFWMIMISYKIFGIHYWSYKLPGVACFFLGVYYVYLFAGRFYNDNVARIAVLVALLTQHGIMSNTDVRAEAYLFCFLIGAIYHLSKLKDTFKIPHLLLAAVLTAFAVMTKGLFVLIGIYGALFGELLLTKQLNKLWQPRYVVLLLITIVLVLPELIALYQQFDLHPEKVVFGHKLVSGIRFFLWDSQFGRFLNTGPIRRSSGSVFFILHTLLWAYAPWCFVLYYALVNNVRKIIRKEKLAEYYTLSGGLVLLLLFSLSGFQLPFYTNILFPLFSIIVADALSGKTSPRFHQFIMASQTLYIVVFILLICIINFLFALTPALKVAISICWFVLLAIILFYIFKPRQAGLQPVFYMSCAIMILINSYLVILFYPRLSSFKAEISAARFLNSDTKAKIFVLENKDNIFQFCVNKPVQLIPISAFGQQSNSASSYYYIHQESLDYLKANHINYHLVKAFKDYPRENILPKLLMDDRRASVLDDVYIVTK